MNKLPIFQKGTSGNINFKKDGVSQYFYTLSLFSFIFAVLAIFMILVIRLFQLTIVKGEYYRRLADENRIKEVVIEPRRGKILDRKGFIIAQSTAADIKKSGERLTSQRIYHEPAATAHFVGYRQIADNRDIKNYPCLTKPALNDRVGKKGIEKIYECELRGISGRKLIELNAKGQEMKTLSVALPTDGATIRTSLDLDIQKKAYEQLSPDGEKKGAAIALKPKTGEVLAWVSTPTFNPGDFENNNQSAIKSILTDEDYPLFNRVSEGTYPPGSIYKLVVAAGGLEDKKINTKMQFEDTGKIKAGPIEFGNWYFLQYGKTEGMVNITRAIKRSNDIYFYRAGARLGPERIKYWSGQFGYGRRSKSAFDEAAGLIPSPFWKEETVGDRWYLGDTYNLAIGQGYVLVTPLQATLATSVFASGGELCEPKLLKDEKPECKKIPIAPDTLDIVTEGMKQACAPGGTGWPLFDFKIEGRKIDIACKTGTAESLDKKTAPHAWITLFAPIENPEIVLTVMVEQGGQGSDVAGPIAREILKTYFGRKE